MYDSHFYIFEHLKTTSQNQRDKLFMVSNERCLIIDILDFEMSVSLYHFPSNHSDIEKYIRIEMKPLATISL